MATVALLTTERQHDMPKSSDNAYLIFLALAGGFIAVGGALLLASTFWPNS